MPVHFDGILLLGNCVSIAFSDHNSISIFQACADLPLWVSIALFGSIGTLYTTIGGFKSVIWTDAFQTVVVFIGVFAKIVMGRLFASCIVIICIIMNDQRLWENLLTRNIYQCEVENILLLFHIRLSLECLHPLHRYTCHLSPFSPHLSF